MNVKTFIICSLVGGMIGGFLGVGLIGWTYTYDTATPSGADSPTILDDIDRETKAAIQERMDVDHYWPLTGTEVSDGNAGKHERVTFFRSGSADCNLHTEDYCDTGELFWTDPCSNVLRLTYDGYLYVHLANDDYAKARNNADDGDVNVLKLDANDVVVLGSGIDHSAASNAVADKSYVDDYTQVSGRLYEAGGSQVIGDTWEVVALDTEDANFATGATITTGAAAKITIPTGEDGLYIVSGHIYVGPLSDNQRNQFVGVRLNGSTIVASQRTFRISGADLAVIDCFAIVKLVATDYVQLVAMSTTNDTIIGNITDYGPISELIVQKIRDL